MKMAILGNGNVGKALAKHCLRLGHSVVFGVRDAGSASVAQALADCKGASAASPAQAVQGADLVFIALPWAAVQAVLSPLATKLNGKIVVDCTNAYEIAGGCVKPAAFPSAAEVLQRHIPDAKVVKAFNQLGAAKLARPHFPHSAPWMGVAGDDSESVDVVVQLAQGMGFDAIAFGGLSASLLLEDMARIWIHTAYIAGLGPNVGFALLRG